MSEGWKPLCDFVGVDMPSKPFPHSNQKGSLVVDVGFFPRVHKMAIVFRIRLLILMGLLIAVASFFIKRLF